MEGEGDGNGGERRCGGGGAPYSFRAMPGPEVHLEAGVHLHQRGGHDRWGSMAPSPCPAGEYL